jgi:NAD(P)-dependent dehydrogenase (short-subunit alcohol dehydrogenase family)
MQNKNNKTALVTGANKGIGYQIAKALVENGYQVYLGSRNLENGEKAATEIGGNIQAIELDITNAISVKNAIEKVKQQDGCLDLLVNNAAISNIALNNRTMEEVLAAQMPSVVPIEELRAVWETNVFSTLAVTQAFLPLLRKSQKARIVNVSSGLGSLTLNSNPENPFRNGFDAAYGASKTALNGIMLSLAIELEKENINVTMVSPGFTATELNNFQGTDTVEFGSLEPIRVALSENIPTGSFTGPKDISGADHHLPW